MVTVPSQRTKRQQVPTTSLDSMPSHDRPRAGRSETDSHHALPSYAINHAPIRPHENGGGPSHINAHAHVQAQCPALLRVGCRSARLRVCVACVCICSRVHATVRSLSVCLSICDLYFNGHMHLRLGSTYLLAYLSVHLFTGRYVPI